MSDLRPKNEAILRIISKIKKINSHLQEMVFRVCSRTRESVYKATCKTRKTLQFPKHFVFCTKKLKHLEIISLLQATVAAKNSFGLEFAQFPSTNAENTVEKYDVDRFSSFPHCIHIALEENNPRTTPYRFRTAPVPLP